LNGSTRVDQSWAAGADNIFARWQGACSSQIDLFSVLALASTGGSIIARDKVAAQKDDEIRKLQPRKIGDEQRANLIEGEKSTRSLACRL
jgi:hypothetical protein